MKFLSLVLAGAISLGLASTAFAGRTSARGKQTSRPAQTGFSLPAARKVMRTQILDKTPVAGGWSRLRLLSVSGTKTNPVFELRAISKQRVDPSAPGENMKLFRVIDAFVSRDGATVIPDDGTDL